MLCVGSACMYHTHWCTCCTIKYILFVLLVYHTCTSRSVMTFNLFSRLYLHCSTKRLLEQLPKQYLALTIHFHRLLIYMCRTQQALQIRIFRSYIVFSYYKVFHCSYICTCLQLHLSTYALRYISVCNSVQ